MKKVFKSVLLISVLAASLLSCSRLFEDDEPISNARNSGNTGNSGGGGNINRDSLGGKGREVKLEQITKPSIGDVVYYTTETTGEKGHVTTTSNYPTTGLGDDHILGYVYAISGDTISVVSKTIHTDKKWAATQGGAVYTGTLPDNNNTDYPNKKLSEVLNGVPDGYTAWADKISKWNKKALFKNYQAISIALGDKKFKDYGGIATSGTSGEVQAVTSFVEGANGGNIRERWYLPNAAELESIYSRVGDLEKNKFFAEPSSPTSNDSMGAELTTLKLSGRLFWSCEVAQSGDGLPTGANKENYAKYVSFVPSDSGTKAADKYTPKNAQNNSIKVDVIAVANFKYSSL